VVYRLAVSRKNGAIRTGRDKTRVAVSEAGSGLAAARFGTSKRMRNSPTPIDARSTDGARPKIARKPFVRSGPRNAWPYSYSDRDTDLAGPSVIYQPETRCLGVLFVVFWERLSRAAHEDAD
jgi:hypothetical protein